MRLFVGVELDDRIKAAAADVAERARQKLQRSRMAVDARWIAPENLHITVWFIGDVKDDRADGIVRALQPAFAVAPFDLHVVGCGAFPSSGPPRVFWLGVTSGVGSMRQLYDAVEERLIPLGFQPEKRAYSPHVTIARVKDIRGKGRDVRGALASLPADCGTCRVAAVTLFRSRLSPKGSNYEPLLRVPLT